jgi:alginate O-acetyltransferase complex protein AlgI
MLFNSFVFLIFALVFFALWQVFSPNRRSRWWLLTLASFFFYGWWDWRFVSLLLGSGLLVYYIAIAMEEHPRHKKALLGLSLFANLGCLVLFKYLGFITENVNWLGHFFGLAKIPQISLLLPLGISFFTFECLSYTVDVYHGSLKAIRSKLHFYAFLSLFPHLIAGPIIRPSDLLPQLETLKKVDSAKIWEGMKLIIQGYFKKVVIADNLAPSVNAAFAATTMDPSMPYWWVVVTMFAFQIYCDFSGYTDIARGLAKWMGYEFPTNFNHPYIASSFSDFWGRWHISLSSWFRDYVYIPLGGSKKGVFMGVVFMWITMLVSGFWHGAAWTFVIWGALHALFLTVERLTQWQKRLGKIWIVGRWLATLLILAQVWIAWVFFRARSLDQALGIVSRMFDMHHLSLSPIATIQIIAFPVLLVGILWEAICYFRLHDPSRWIGRLFLSLENAALIAMIVASVYFRGPGGAFIYFQF